MANIVMDNPVVQINGKDLTDNVSKVELSVDEITDQPLTLPPGDYKAEVGKDGISVSFVIVDELKEGLERVEESSRKVGMTMKRIGALFGVPAHLISPPSGHAPSSHHYGSGAGGSAMDAMDVSSGAYGLWQFMPARKVGMSSLAASMNAMGSVGILSTNAARQMMGFATMLSTAGGFTPDPEAEMRSRRRAFAEAPNQHVRQQLRELYAHEDHAAEMGCTVIAEIKGTREEPVFEVEYVNANTLEPLPLLEVPKLTKRQLLFAERGPRAVSPKQRYQDQLADKVREDFKRRMSREAFKPMILPP